MSSPPPPPPPPHGEAPKTTAGGGGPNLPPGKYDVFIIPDHSAGSGFLYLPSLRTNTNSFIAGFSSALLMVVIGQTFAPAFQTWWHNFQGMGNAGMALLVVAVGLGAWSLGRQTSDSSGPSRGGWGGGGFYSAGPSMPGAGGAGGFTGTGPSSHSAHPGSPPPNAGPPPGAQSPPPPKTDPNGSYQRPPEPPPKPQQTKPKPQADTSKNAWEKAREEVKKKEEDRKAKEAEEKRRAEATQRLKELREKEARERAQREAEKAKREQEAREKAAKEQAARDREAREKQAKERRERELREARERKERELREARERKERELREANERKERELREANERKEKELREAREKELKERLARDREERRKRVEAERKRKEEEAEKKRKEEEAEKKRKDEEEAASQARKSSTYAYSGVGEKMSPWPNGKPPSVVSSPPPSVKRPPPPPSATSVGDDASAYSYRPYDSPKRPARRPSNSDMSESSYAPSHSTARTTPPPSFRGGYSTKDPDKIVVKGVYSFVNQYAKTPASQLISGLGTVTDGLILRITTEGLFIDDDVRGVAQREWDVKAWTLKLVEVWCPVNFLVGAIAANVPPSPNGSKSPSPALSDISTAFFGKMVGGVTRLRAAERSAPKPMTDSDADEYLTDVLRSCKDSCRFGDCASKFASSNLPDHSANRTHDAPSMASGSTRVTNNTAQTGEWKANGIHLLRATVRDQEGKRYLFVIGEEEGWKLSLGLQRLRRGTQARGLGVTGLSALETKTTLDLLGWTT